MLYLEDYLEMIENLPMEMRDRFTEMREMDLQVQNTMDSMDDRVKAFFRKCQPSLEPRQQWKDEQFRQIKNEYGKALEDADEKVQLANQIYDMVDRYLRKLDQELAKFKMELEADNAGITEVLERRSLELDKPNTSNQNHKSEKRKASSMYNYDKHNHHSHRTTPSNHSDKVLSSLANESARGDITSSGSHRSSSSHNSQSSSNNSTSLQNSSMSYNLGHVGANSNAAIAAAASKAIGATLGMSHGRRTASLKASYEAVSRNADLSKELFPTTPDPSLAPSPAGSIIDAPINPTPSSSKARHKKTKLTHSHSSSQLQHELQSSAPTTPAPTEGMLPPLGDDLLGDNSISTYGYDPNEPRYCTCNDVSWGEMVGCDNSDCPIEWFHYACVGLREAPKGKWYCPQCTAAMKRRGNRK